MFTGLIKEVGRIESLSQRGPGALLTMSTKLLPPDTAVGDSISVSGVCLTVVSVGSASLGFEVSRQTLERTSLARGRAGDLVNLEPSLMAGDKLGGHFVYGHVDTVAEVIEARAPASDADGWLTVRCRDAKSLDVMALGSIAVDGISLTVQEIREKDICSVIIPHTWKATNLFTRRPGDLVNIEYDPIVKALRSVLSGIMPGLEGLSLEKLSEWGY